MADVLYARWNTMRQRCDNVNSHKYKQYGGRGISYDKRWESFKEFKNDMGASFLESAEIRPTLDRIDNNGNYSKENCRWVSNKVQSNNRRNNRVISHLGKTMTLAQWADFVGIKYSTLKQRFYCMKLSFEKCITEGRLRWQTASFH